MGTSQKSTEQQALSQDEELVREELARLLRSETLRRSPSHLRLLQYLVENKLQGDHGALREMAIGIEVFQRNPASFDPKEDPIVRVNVGRLREKIEQHYAQFEQPPRIRIELPKGRYIPQFVSIDERREGVQPRLAILPIVAESEGDATAAWLFDTLVEHMQALSQVRVLGTRSVRAIGDLSALDAAKRLSASAILSARLSFESGFEHLHAMLIGAPHGGVIGSWRFKREDSETLGAWVETLGEKLRDVIVEKLTGMHRGEYQPAPRRKGLVGADNETVNAFVESRKAAALGTEDGHRKARDLLEAAIQRAPDTAILHAYLAGTMGNLSAYSVVTPEEAFRVGSAASQRAIELDPNEPTAYLNLAGDAIYYEYDFAKADALLGHAQRLAIQHPGVRLLRGNLESLRGNLAASLAAYDRAIELDPLYPAAKSNKGVALMFARRYAEAQSLFLALLEEFPQRTNTRNSLGTVLIMTERHDEAKALYSGMLTNDPDDADARLGLAIATARCGDRAQAARVVRDVAKTSDVEATNPSSLAAAWCQVGENAKAIKLLERSADIHEGGFAEVQVQPLYEPLHADAGFVSLLAKHRLRALPKGVAE
jgi:tetratricopeptide (TPR) repeat protein